MDAHSRSPLASAAGVKLQAAHLTSPKPGERANGDAVLVRHDGELRAILAVIDGLGHGPDAAQASSAAVEALNRLEIGTPVSDAMSAVHAALRGSRGAAGTVCVIDGLRMEMCAVGNVQLLSVNFSVPLVLSAGILGHQVAKFRVSGCELRPGSRLALLSDGISVKFRLEEFRHLAPAEVCDLILSKHRRKEDDATVLIADVRR